MKYGICRWMDAAIRAEASHKSEMVSQLLFGECYQVLEEVPEWVKISTADCHYEGWISQKQHTEISESEYKSLEATPSSIMKSAFAYVRDAATKLPFPIFIGSRIPKNEDGKFSLAGREYSLDTLSGPTLQRHEGLTEQQDELLAFAFQYLNAPYLWGGRTPAGIDCSGFTQNVFRSIGIDLPRDASQQVSYGETVDFVDEAQIGDIAFFENSEGSIVHVGIVCGQRQIIHASGCVQINTLDDTGIFNQELKKYTHQLRIIKRVL